MKNSKTLSILNNNNFLRTPALAASVFIALHGNLHAAPGALSDNPLFLSSQTPSNIFFMIDDSGSMDWADLLNQGTQNPGGAILSDNTIYNPPSGAYGSWWDRTFRRLYCRGFNVMAYDPTVTYTPWEGKDNAGNTYGNMSVTSARDNPYLATGSTTNLSNHYYWLWNDLDGDGAYDGPGSTDSGAASNPATDECGDVSSNGGGVLVNTLTAAEKTNYANWYSYYRKREYVAKRAVSSVIKSSSSRAGLATLHNNNSVRTLIADIDDISTPLNTTAASNKNTLLDNLFQINSSGGTPLRQSLESVGEYYKDGGSWAGSSPILGQANGGECQQNFAILMSDGTWNGNNPSVGDADTDNNTIFDGGVYADPAILAETDPENGPISVNTLADVAMYYYETDLSTLANLVPTATGIDENPAQHMVTYTVAFGVNGTLTSGPQTGDTSFAWPAPFDNAQETIDDMRHAAFNGRGDFLSAGDPQQLINTLSSAIADIQTRTGTAAAVSFNSTSLQTNTKLLRAAFDSARWSGDVVAYNIDLANNTLGSVAWRATTDLDSVSTTSSTRKIVTFDGTNGINFDWSTITANQKNDLRTNSSGTLDNEATGIARLDYIRGHRGCELGSATALTCSYTDSSSNTFNSKSFRQRNSRLGDIIHSSPTYVGPPATPYPDNIEATPYRNFVNTYSSRAGITYVGANDGMLHAFNETGQEVFGYIPNLLFSTANGAGLHHLTETGYVHKYYVDLSTTVADVFADLGSGTTQWHSVLVGGLRGGGKGLFAIDVTNPANFSSATGVASKVLWEFTHNDLGYTFSNIRIGRMNNGKWAAIFGNGYNNDPLGDGKAKLFILYLDGSNLNAPIILETGAGSITNADCDDANSDCNGMSTPTTADINGDGSIDRIYAGDLHGNMWAFDVSSNTTSNWASAYGSGPTYTPLFRACSGNTCSTANRQPITSKPSVARHPFKRDITTEPNLMVFFGTGQYLTTTDNSSSATQSFYGVWDSGSGNLDRTNLQSQTLNNTTTGGISVRTVSDNYVDYSTKKGWRIDLPTSKERTVTNSTAFGSLVFFNTMIPSTSACSAGGFGWLMAVDILNGGEPSFIPIDINNDGVFDASDQAGGSSMSIGTMTNGIPTDSRIISNTRVTPDSNGGVTMQKIQASPPGPPDRMSWTGLEQN